MLDHPVLNKPELKNLSKRAKFEQKQQFLGGVLAVAPFKLQGRAPNPLAWVLGSPPDHQTPMGLLIV